MQPTIFYRQRFLYGQCFSKQLFCFSSMVSICSESDAPPVGAPRDCRRFAAEPLCLHPRAPPRPLWLPPFLMDCDTVFSLAMQIRDFPWHVWRQPFVFSSRDVYCLRAGVWASGKSRLRCFKPTLSTLLRMHYLKIMGAVNRKPYHLEFETIITYFTSIYFVT